MSPSVSSLLKSYMPLVLAAAVAVVAFHAVTNVYAIHVLILAMIWAVFAIGWNIAAGIVGLKAFGHQAFFGIGAYASALLAMHMGWSPWLTMLLGAMIAALASLVVIAPVLRLSSPPQIAIVTLAFAEMTRIMIMNLDDLTRGEMGLIGIPIPPGFSVPLLGTLQFSAAIKTGYFLVAAITLIVILLVVVTFTRSRYGLAAVAVRNAPVAAESLGVNVTVYRIALFGFSAFLVGLAGAFYGHYLMVLTPDDTTGLALMVMIIAMTIIGGLGGIYGPVVGALLVTIGLEMLRGFDDYRLLAFGILTILVMRFMPNGITHGIAAAWQQVSGKRTDRVSIRHIEPATTTPITDTQEEMSR